MAITANNLTVGEDNTDLTVYTTASVAPATAELQLLTLYSATGAEDIPTSVVGNSLTWVLVGSVVLTNRTIALYRAMGTPTTGTIAITYPSEQTGLCWSLTEFGGDIDTTGTNGSGATNSDSNVATNSDSSANGLTVTLAAFSSAGNATFGGFGTNKNSTSFTAGSGFALLGSAQAHDTPNQGSVAQWRDDNDTTVDIAETSGGNWVGIAVELFAAVAGGLSVPVAMNSYRRRRVA